MLGPLGPDKQAVVPAQALGFAKIHFAALVQAGDPRVRRANLDGTGVENLITSGLFEPVGIALDTVHGKLYWTDLEGSLDGTGSIQRANLDGSDRETLLTHIDEASGLACDVGGGKIYWTQLGTKNIQRANLDGTGVEDLVTNLINPTTITLDLVARKMYWTDSIWDGPPPRIQKANLDGSNVETIVSGIGFPWGIAVDERPMVNLIKAVKPAFSELSVGTNYLMQVSSDLKTWTNEGSAFAATNTSMVYPHYWDVDNWNQLFFRLQVAP